LKVLVLAYRFIPELGGYETLINEITKRLADRDIEVVVACFTRRRDLPSQERLGKVHVLRLFVRRSQFYLPRRVEWLFASLVDRVFRHKSDLGKPLSLLTQFFVYSSYVPCSSWRLSTWLTGVISAERPDVLHVFDSRTAVSLYPVAFLTRTPVVVTFPGTAWATSIKARIYDKLCFCLGYGWYVMHEDGSGAARRARMMGMERVSEFFAGVDTDLFDPRKVSRAKSRASFGISDSTFVFGILGRIEDDKGVREVILSFLNSAKQTDILLVVGEIGEKRRYYDDLVRLVEGNPNGGLVKFIGPIERLQVPAFLAACDAILLNGRRTNFNLTFAETLMMGRPMIVRADGLDVFKDKIGRCPTVLLHNGAISEISRAMETIREREIRTEFSETELALAREMFTWDAVVAKVIAAYDNVLSKSGNLASDKHWA